VRRVTETRKLTTILALDMVGYSRATERDDSAAAEAIRKTRDVLARASAAHGGRIFSSAGDGFMLEFPTATAGFEAALAMLNAFETLEPPLLVRIGLHTGEVIVEQDGDLLGHAVNIAARLQQRAKPKEIVLSEEVKRSARGTLTGNLISLGDVKLDKMSETMDIYVASAGKPGLRAPRFGRRTRLAAIGAGLLVAGALGAAWMLQPSRDVRTAVFTIQAPSGDAELVSLASGVTSEIVDSLHQIAIETIAPSETVDQRRSIAERARSLGAAFTLDGDIVREGETVRVSVRLNDVYARQTLWAQSFERESRQARELRLEAASAVIAIMECAIAARRDAPELAPSALSMLLRSCELSLSGEGLEEALRLAEQVAGLAPRSSFLQGRLANTYWLLAYTGSQPDESLVAQAYAAADAALRLDNANAEALMVKIDRLAYTASLREWEEGLLSALSRAPDNADLNWYYAWFLRTFGGRPGEAVQYQRRAFARRPLSPGFLATLAFMLASTGADREAIALLANAEARWPGHAGVWYERFRINLWFGSRTEALRLLDEAPSGFSTAEIQCWRRVATGLATNANRARREVARAAQACWPPEDRYVVLASIGEVDDAFADVERLLAECPDANTVLAVGGATRALPRCLIDFSWRTMFYPMTASMRRDPRFMPLMRRAGLLQYWLETDRWPEFCEEASLPYDCRQEARRLLGPAQQQ
jgi:class 3 adenylate cyclase/TolB-like protein